MTSKSWGTKRSCPKCNAPFYDLGKTPATCPKCQHEFTPAVAVSRAKRKVAKNAEPESQKITAALPLAKKVKEKKFVDTEGAGEDIVEIEDGEDNLAELSELEEREEEVVHGDDADDESIIEDLGDGEKTIVGNVEEEEASALVDELEDENEADKKKPSPKKKN